MTGLGCGRITKKSINNVMKYFWILIAIIVCASIYWIMEWHDKHEDGE